MRVPTIISSATILACTFARPFTKSTALTDDSPTYKNVFKATHRKPFSIVEPKVFIVNSFKSEAKPWLSSLDFHHNITIPGLSSLYPAISCTTNYSVCGMITGEGDINAAASVMALGLSPLFDLSHTYFLISGIAHGDPNHTTVGSVTFARYAVQVGVEHEVVYQGPIVPNPNWTSTYGEYGPDNPWTYPGKFYGTEVYEVNGNLRDRAVELAHSVNLENPTQASVVGGFLYGDCAARDLPSIVKCDVLTSDDYFTGKNLSDYFSFYANVISNGTVEYCSVAQEDNAYLEAFTRLDRYGLVDFDRVVVSRSISDLTRPPPPKCNDTVTWFDSPGESSVAFANLPIAGLPFVKDVLENWENVYCEGDKYASNYYTRDILESFEGTPNPEEPSIV
ncbi:hypothetical protein JCM33374_g4826 [Metschnikowia sp. JCM 33374]|nr:hypothetical protein JCM33374_g4826 [Metschnikowia sp. JCM 33374]